MNKAERDDFERVYEQKNREIAAMERFANALEEANVLANRVANAQERAATAQENLATSKLVTP